ncbi:MAG: TlpA family protein disulfide reductase [candidate division NC10 bacterium]|nr:TlpA family protein disulfide reductase [candidate division NC10 bacterium]
MAGQTLIRWSLALVGACALAWGLVALGIALGPPASSAAPAPGLLKALDLAGYPAGEKPPEFSGRTPEGQTVSLARLRGRVVLLNFWATWCLPCKEEMPMFQKLLRDFAPQGLTVMGVNVREGTSEIREYARELSLTFPLVLDANGKIQVLYGVIGLPTTFLIGRDGMAVARAIGPRDWGGPQARALIQALLEERPPSRRAR